MMKVGSLFSGIEGFGLGLERAGMNILWQSENDKDCIRVLQHHYPYVERTGSVEESGKHNLRSVDLACLGFPCTDLSVAGKRKGLAGSRSGLWFEAIRIIGELKPSWVLIENVPGLLSSKGGLDFFVILQGLAKLGYYSAYRVLDSQYFGVAQRRRRVFIVASLGTGRCAEVLFESACGCGNPAPGRKTGQGFARDVAPSLNASGRGTSRDGESRGQDPLVVAIAENQRCEIRGMDVVGSLSTGGGKPGRGYPCVAFGGKQRSHNEKSSHGWTEERHPALTGGQDHNLVAFGGNRQHGPLEVATACNAHGGTGRHDFESETFVVGTLTCNSGPNGHDAGSFACNQAVDAGHIIVVAPPLKHNPYGDHESREGLLTVAFTERTRSAGRTFESQEELAYALTNPGSGGRAHSRSISHQGLVRRLTPTECLRLQGFPDDWLDLDPPLSDSAKYRMAGNAVTVNVIEWIGKRIIEANK